VEFFNKIKPGRSYSIYKHATTLKMAFGANLFLAKIIAGPPYFRNRCDRKKSPGKNNLHESEI
jgi:hypothetical protein